MTSVFSWHARATNAYQRLQDDTVVVKGNHYFPRTAVNGKYLEPSDTTTVCPWKGTANYFTLNVAGKRNVDAVWYYANPKEAAMQIKDRVAFWKGVRLFRKQRSAALPHRPHRHHRA